VRSEKTKKILQVHLDRRKISGGKIDVLSRDPVSFIPRLRVIAISSSVFLKLPLLFWRKGQWALF
jgi:hypothetical protein